MRLDPGAVRWPVVWTQAPARPRIDIRKEVAQAKAKLEDAMATLELAKERHD